MARVKTGFTRRKRHKKILKITKGQYGSRSKLFKRANEAMLKSLWYSYRDRRNRRRALRRLWIARINAASDTGTRPFCHAKPNSRTFAYIVSPIRTLARWFASIVDRFAAPIASPMASTRSSARRLASRFLTKSPVSISAVFTTARV